MEDQVFFVTSTAREDDIHAAIQALVTDVNQQAQERSLDFALAFVTMHFMHKVREVVEGLRAGLKVDVLLGCTAEGVISRQEEIEEQAAIVLVGAHLPGVSVTSFILQPRDWRMELFDRQEFHRHVADPVDPRLFILLADPFSTPVDGLLEAFNAHFPEVAVVGGMASGALRPGANTLFVNDQLVNEGAVGMALTGAFDVNIVVSQGCRPIWHPMTVTTSQRNVIVSLEGKPPLAVIQELVPQLNDEDRFLLENGLFVGQSIRPEQDVMGRGDFLVRGVVGVDPETGAIAVADSVFDGERIQFHLRDAVTAQEDLEMMLIPQVFRDPASGGLLFTCNGRGKRLYDHPNGDISVIQQNLGNIPLGGFFCAGEIGPIGGKNFLHGHTASLVLFRPLL
jgi:small ligand-binding sensory domain FIST